MNWVAEFLSSLSKPAFDSEEETFLFSRGVSSEQIDSYFVKVFRPCEFTLPSSSPSSFVKTYKVLKSELSYVVFPLCDAEGSPIGLQFRSIEGKSYVTCLLTSYAPELFGYPQALACNRRHLVLVEGIFDCLPLVRVGLPVAATLTAGVSPIVARSIARFFDTVYLLFDNDSAGRHAATKGCEMFTGCGVVSRVLSQQKGYKDVGDLWKSLGDEGVRSYVSSLGVGMLEMPTQYHDAETVQSIAERIIPSSHPHLASARMRYVFRDKAAKEGGQPCPGKARRVSGINEFLIGADFVVEVAYDLWSDLDESKRTALVDHLLTYCFGAEDEKDPGAGMKWTIRRPDVKEFTEVLNRHGKWNDSLETFVDAALQIQSGPSYDQELEVEVEQEVSTDTLPV